MKTCKGLLLGCFMIFQLVAFKTVAEESQQIGFNRKEFREWKRTHIKSPIRNKFQWWSQDEYSKWHRCDALFRETEFRACDAQRPPLPHTSVEELGDPEKFFEGMRHTMREISTYDCKFRIEERSLDACPLPLAVVEYAKCLCYPKEWKSCGHPAAIEYFQFQNPSTGFYISSPDGRKDACPLQQFAPKKVTRVVP